MSHKLKTIIWFAAATCSMSMGSVFAQDSTSPESDVIDEIVVTGQRLQNQQSIAIKRQSVQIVDTVTADDIGRQPDFNVADALKRVTGVSTIPEEDEAQFVTIRGINSDLTWVTFDGAAVASSSEGQSRRVSLEFFPSSLVKGLEVVKTRTPEIDGNTIGGQVNMVTRSAFDSDGPFAVATAFAGYFEGDGAPHGIDDGSGSNGPSYRFDGAFSNTFGADDKFGFVIAASYFDKDRDEEREIPIDFQSSGDFTDPSSSYAPGFLIWSTYHNPVERYGVVSKFEWQASDSLYMSLQGMYVYQEDFARRDGELLIGGTPSFDTQFSGTLDDALLVVGHDQFDAKNTFSGFQYEAEFDNDTGLTADFRAAYTEGEFDQDSPDIDFGGPLVDVNYSYDNSLGATEISFVDPAFAQDPTNFPLRRLRPFRDVYNNDITELEASIGWNRGRLGWSYWGGVKYRELSQSNDFGRDQYEYIGDGATLADFQEPTDYSLLFRPGVSTLVANRGAVFDFLDQNPGEFTFTTPDRFEQTYEVEEDVFAAYAAIGYQGDEWEFIGGFRYEDTSTTSTSGAKS